MIDELADLIELYEQGAWSRGDYFYRITLLVPNFALDDVIDELPGSDRKDFVHWLRETYDNDVPADSFVSIGAPGNTALARARIDGIRSWLRANRRVDAPAG